jgi:hypothetical protein
VRFPTISFIGLKLGKLGVGTVLTFTSRFTAWSEDGVPSDFFSHFKAIGLIHCSVFDLAKIVFTFKFSYLLFWNSPIKLKLGEQIGGGVLLANHQDQKIQTN